MKIGFIGFGNIAKAMVSGLLKSDESLKDNIYASAAHYDKLIENTKIYGIHAVKSNSELIDIADIIFICSKPYQVKDIMQNQKLEGKIIVSFAASLDFDDLEAIMPHSHHITSIPNTAISCGKGVHIVDKHHSLDEDELKMVIDLLSKTGYVKIMDSSLVDIASTIIGCTPAYTAMYMEALGDAACKHGLRRDDAYPLIAHMLEGFGTMAYEYNKHPGILKDEVCSPHGSTIKGVASLEKDGFRGAVINAIDEVMK